MPDMKDSQAANTQTHSGDAPRIEMMPPDALIPYENNPRFNDGAVGAVAASIEKFGFRNPVLVDKDLVVIAGHTRIKAAKRLGLAKIPVVVLKDLSPEKAKAFRLADNKTGELAAWDETALQGELDTLAGLGFDMVPFGFGNLDNENEQRISDGEEIDADELDETMELKIVLPFDDYQAVTERLREINPDMAKAIVALCKGEA